MKNKVILNYYDVEGNIAEEKLWIQPLDNNEYQIKNIPFFAPNVAYDDKISVEEEDGYLYFYELIESSEHSTIQIVFLDNTKADQIIREIESLGCSWEGFNRQEIITVDVPPDIHYKKVKEYLNNQSSGNILDYKEACLSETHRNNLC